MANNPPRYIVIDARTSGTSTGRYPENLIKHLALIDQHNNYLCLASSKYLENAPKLPGNFAYMACDYSYTGSMDEQTKFLKELKSLEPDLIHFTMVQQPVFYKGLVVTTIHDLTRVRFVNPSANIVVFKIKQFMYKWVIRLAAQKSEKIIVPTNYVKDDIASFTGQPLKKFVVTYEDATKIKEKADPIKKLVGKKFLMYTGRPDAYKNLRRLIEAFEILKIKHPDLYLILAGKKDANYESIEKSVVNKGLKDVVFTGFVSEGELRWLYENCQAYVIPSLSEGFGLPGLEAMIHGAPVVSSNATSLPEVYGDAAEYFEPTDVGNMADAIDKVLTKSEVRKALVEKGYKQVAKYSWEKMARQTLLVYEEVLG